MNRRQHEQMVAAATRYRATARDRREIRRRQKADGTRVVDTPDQVRARATRLVRSGQLPAEALVSAIVPGEDMDPQVFLERIIGATNDLQAANFLPRGARSARTIARVALDGGRGGFGTGYLVAPSLLLTNNHVLPDVGTAELATAEFNHEIDLDQAPGVVVAYGLDPGALFLTDEHLDFTLVAVQPGPDGRPPGEEFGWNRLIAQQGKIVIGEPVNVAGHPQGRLKEISIRNNHLENQLDDFLHYVTDTEPGNSGSPVLNDQWEVVALHHSGVPRTDDDGNTLKKDGSVWSPGDDPEDVDWVANEGVRVSVLLGHLAERRTSLGAAERELLATMGPQAFPITAPRPPRHTETPRQPRPGGQRELSTAGLAARRPPLGGDTHLVYLHGRRQEGKDPQALRAKWTAGLGNGLALAGLPAVDAADAWFPFYGDAFAAALAGREAVTFDPAEAVVDPAEAFAPEGESTRAVYESLLQEAAAAAGMPGEAAADHREGLGGLIGRLQRPLSWLANRSGLDEALIATIFRDVASYLDRDEVRQLVLDTVLETVPSSGRMILVSHSLGTVVAMDLFTRLPDELEVVHLTTAGSPLGMDGVFKRLLVKGPRRPPVTEWLNAWCAADAVAIGCPLRDDWGDGLTEVITNNPKDRAHSIEEYLADARVAAAIGAALDPSRG